MATNLSVKEKLNSFKEAEKTQTKRNFIKENVVNLQNRKKIRCEKITTLGSDSESMKNSIKSKLDTELQNKNVNTKISQTNAMETTYNPLKVLFRAQDSAQFGVLFMDQGVQTCDVDSELFLKGAKILHPSVELLKNIRNSKNMKLLKTKFIEEHFPSAHLSNLKEYLDTGFISKSKNVEFASNKLALENKTRLNRIQNHLWYENNTKLTLGKKLSNQKVGKVEQFTRLDGGDGSPARKIPKIDFTYESCAGDVL